MGNKIDPEGFRVGVSRDWKSHWYAGKKERVKNILQDRKIRVFLKKRLESAGLSSVSIERSISLTVIKVTVSRPGVVIGKAGSGSQLLKEELLKMLGGKVELSVEEETAPDISAKLISQSIVRQIEKRMPYKRAMVMSAEKAMEKGALGIKIKCAGVLGGPSSIARSEKIVRGSVPLQTLRADIDYSQVAAFTSYGNIGIKVWVYKGEVK